MVVLGCKLRPDGSPTPELAQRVGAACRAFKQRENNAKLLFAGGGRLPVKEATIMQSLAERDGIARSDILTSPNGNSTLENAVFAHHHLGKATRVVVITSLYHVDRVQFIFDKVFSEEVDVEVAGVKVAASEGPPPIHREKQLLADLTLFESLC